LQLRVTVFQNREIEAYTACNQSFSSIITIRYGTKASKKDTNVYGKEVGKKSVHNNTKTIDLRSNCRDDRLHDEV